MFVQIPLSRTLLCSEFSDKLILVTGSHFIKVLSLKTYKELNGISSEEINYESLVTPDEKSIFIATSRGLRQYSLSDLALVKVHRPLSNGFCLRYLNKKKKIIFSDVCRLLSLDLITCTVTMFHERHKSHILKIVSTSNEDFLFTTGYDRTLKQWRTDSLSLVKSVELESEGRSLLVKEKTDSILVGLRNGSLAEYSLEDLNLIRTVEVHHKLISRIIKLSSGDVVTCSSDGSICLPFQDNVQIKASEKEINSVTELSDKTIACCCEDGLRIIPSPVQDPLLSARIDSLSSSLQSIRKSTSDQKPQLISLLQHHLTQLLTPIQRQPEKFTGLALSLLPDLKSIQRNHLYEDSSEGRRKILTQSYVLETIGSNLAVSDLRVILTLFSRKLKLQGWTNKVDNPISSFRVEKVRRKKWVFSMHDQTKISGRARVNFINGYLDCYTFDGYIIDRSGFQITLAVDGVVNKIVSVGTDGMVVTADRRSYFLNLKTNRIDHKLLY